MTRATTYDVRFRGIRKYKGKRGTTYTVRWSAAGKDWQKTFPTAKLADGHRANLMAAARAGEPFDLATGLPLSLVPSVGPETWLEHAVDFMEMKWPDSAPKYRKSLAESLTRVTLGLLIDGNHRPDAVDLRRALFSRIFVIAKPSGTVDDGLQGVATWLQTHSRPLSDLADPAIVRSVLDSISTNLDERRASEATIARRRSAFHNCLEYAVEIGTLSVNPLDKIRRKRLPPAPAIDRRRVANPAQARLLLAAVAESDPELEAFFATLYFAGPRPGEVLNLRRNDCDLPQEGWGRLLFSSSFQRAGTAWTDSGEPAEERQLKHRAIGDTRPVPAHPELVGILRRHIARHGLGPDGRLFVARTGRAGARLAQPHNNPPSMNTVYRAWHRARRSALSTEEFNSPLARRPYDLRHACLSTWLNAGVPPVQVAEWAGHSVAVLLTVYAKCIDGQDALAMKQIENALGG